VRSFGQPRRTFKADLNGRADCPASPIPKQHVDMPRRLILTCSLSPGDIVMMTAALRDLHLAHPGEFQTDVRTSAGQLWENNPYLTRLSEDDPGVEVVPMRYDL